MTKPSKEVEKNWAIVGWPRAVDIQDIWEQAAQNRDPDKCKLFDALYTYLLDKRQEQIINEKHFLI